MAQISIIKYSDILEAKRIDAEYFKPEYLKIERKLKKLNSKKLGNSEISLLITDGDHGNPKYNLNGIPYLKVEEITSTGIKLPANHNLSYNYANKQSKKNYVFENEVLITTVGTIGKTCVVDKNITAILSRDIAKIKLKTCLNPFFTNIFRIKIWFFSNDEN